jgi:hypothetical protein
MSVRDLQLRAQEVAGAVAVEHDYAGVVDERPRQARLAVETTSAAIRAWRSPAATVSANSSSSSITSTRTDRPSPAALAAARLQDGFSDLATNPLWSGDPRSETFP